MDVLYVIRNGYIVNKKEEIFKEDDVLLGLIFVIMTKKNVSLRFLD